MNCYGKDTAILLFDADKIRLYCSNKPMIVLFSSKIWLLGKIVTAFFVIFALKSDSIFRISDILVWYECFRNDLLHKNTSKSYHLGWWCSPCVSDMIDDVRRSRDRNWLPALFSPDRNRWVSCFRRAVFWIRKHDPEIYRWFSNWRMFVLVWYIIRKTKCFRHAKRNVQKAKRNVFVLAPSKTI